MTVRPPALRGLLAGGALAAVLLAGCGTPAPRPPDGGNGSGDPSQGQSQSPTPTAPLRSVTANNLLTLDQVPIDGNYESVKEMPEGKGRRVAESYICLPADGLSSLGATAMVSRDFGFTVSDPDLEPFPDSPLKGKPAIYTQALQFPDEAAATKARETYVGWITGCPAQLQEKGYTIDKAQSFAPTKAKVEGGHAIVGMTAYVPPGSSDGYNLIWESAGVTQVHDRLMITISLSWGEDTPGTLDTSDGDYIHPQVTLVEESVTQLKK